MTKAQIQRILKEQYGFTVSLKAKKTTFMSIWYMARNQDETSDVTCYDDIYYFMKRGYHA